LPTSNSRPESSCPRPRCPTRGGESRPNPCMSG
jgi:hypothetical protein